MCSSDLKILAELTLREKQENSDGQSIDDQLIELRLDQRKEVLNAAYLVEKERDALSRREGKGPASSVDEYQRRLRDAEDRLKEVREEVRPKVVEELKERTLLEASVSKQMLQRKLSLLEIEIEGFEKQLVYEDEAKSSKLSWQMELDEADTSIKQYRSIFNRLQEEGERARMNMSNLMRVEKFKDATLPSQPDMAKKIMATGGVGGGVFGLIFIGILFLDLRTRRINSLDDVVTGLRLPVLGSVPIIPSSRGGKGGESGGGQRWQGALIESIDSARVMLLRRASLENAKVEIGRAHV